MWAKKNKCGQENLSVLSVSVSVDCRLWTVDYDSAVSGEPPCETDSEAEAAKSSGLRLYLLVVDWIVI